MDPAAYDRIAAADEKRIIRALEVWHETGKTITQHNLETQQRPPRYRAVTIGLNFAEKAALWERINRRVDEMMAQGLAEEVRQLLASGVPRPVPPCRPSATRSWRRRWPAGGPGRRRPRR